jgi:cell division protease FtsH
MVALYGMSDRVGLANCAQRQPSFLDGQQFQIQRDCSEETARTIDEEVKKLLAVAYAKAKETLTTHRDQLEKVTSELLKAESVDGPTFYRLVGKETPMVKEPAPLNTAAAEAH